MRATRHPLGELIVRALDGEVPAADGAWQRVPPWRTGVEAVFAMTGHAVLAVGDDITDERLQALGVDGFGGAHHPRVVLELAGPHGWIDSLDAVLAARSSGGPSSLVERADLADHPRARFARAMRDDVRVVGPADRASRSLATVSRGIGSLWELSVEVDPHERGRGLAARLVSGALACLPAGDVALAAIAPGNVASDRVFRMCGFRLIGSIQEFRPARDSV